MLLFRSEEHVERWRERTRRVGEIFPLETCARLAHAWYADRLAPDWRRRTLDEAQALFASLGLGSDFWKLG
jgi:hypothetical protein